MPNTTIAQQIADAITDVDATFGFEIKLVGLVDGESTYRLRMEGCEGATFPDYDDAAEAMRRRRDQRRADAILGALLGPESKVDRERAAGGVSWLGYTEDQVRAWLADKSRRFMGPDNRYGHALAALGPASDGEG